MFGFKKKQQEKERKKEAAIKTAKEDQAVRAIEEIFPTKNGLRSFLGNSEHITRVLNIAMGNVPKDRSLFLKFLGRDPDDVKEREKFEKMYSKINE